MHVLLQWASQNFVSDAAMEGTLQGRAEYAGILADLGFLPVSYVASCRNSAHELDSHYDECSLNARVIKAAICAGERRLSCCEKAFLTPWFSAQPLCLFGTVLSYAALKLRDSPSA